VWRAHRDGATGYGHLVGIRVVVAEDSLIVREGLQQLLAASPTLDVVAAYGDVESVLDRVDRDRPRTSWRCSKTARIAAAIS
jgi:hypothetical protein